MSTATREETVYNSASILVVQGEALQAIEQLIDELKQTPDSGRLWELRGEAHLTAGDPIDAINCLEHASCLIPLSVEARFALAHAYELSGKHELAGDLYVMMAEGEAPPLSMLEPLASALGRVNKPEHALSVCTQAASRMPGSPSPLLGMAFYQRRLNYQPERILPVLFRALHLAPEDFDLRMTLARMLHECGQASEAAELLGCVDVETSRCPSCLAAMQQIFQDAGNQERAAGCVDALVRLADENPS